MSTYPAWAAGQRVTAALLTAAQPAMAYKLADQSVSSSTTGTTLINDSHLFLPLAINATYELVYCYLAYDGQTPNADIKLAFTLPTGAVMRWAPWGGAIGSPSAVDTVDKDASAGARPLGTFGFPARMTARPAGRITTSSTAGNLQLQWAQNTANATATTLYAGSCLGLLRIS